MSTFMKPLCYLALFLSACSEAPLKAPELTPPSGTTCNILTIEVLNAPWAKDPAEQEDHRLRVMGPEGEPKFYTLGIDRSPDFTFKIIPKAFNDFMLIRGASRLLAFDCRAAQLQELDLSLDKGFEGQDAQSGLINALEISGKDQLVIGIVDHRAIELTLTAERRFVR